MSIQLITAEQAQTRIQPHEIQLGSEQPSTQTCWRLSRRQSALEGLLAVGQMLDADEPPSFTRTRPAEIDVHGRPGHVVAVVGAESHAQVGTGPERQR